MLLESGRKESIDLFVVMDFMKTTFTIARFVNAMNHVFSWNFSTREMEEEILCSSHNDLGINNDQIKVV